MKISNLFMVNLKKNRQGSALAFIIIIFTVISIFATSVLFMFNANLKQAKHQEQALEAYYLAYSGVEMAFTAITDSSNKLLKNISNDSVASYSEDDIEFGGGYIDIIVVKSVDSNLEGWIKITSTGTLKKDNQSYTRTMYINPSNTNDVVWINN